MAKILPGIGYSSAAGSLNALTFRTERGGLVIRARARRVDTQASLQQLRRAHFGRAARRWRSLSSANRQLWEKWSHTVFARAALASDQDLDGFTAFVALTCQQRMLFGADLTQPPPIQVPNNLQLFNFSAVIATSTLSVQFLNIPSAATTFTLFASAPFPPGQRAHSHRPLRMLATRASGALGNWGSQYSSSWYPILTIGAGYLTQLYGVAAVNDGRFWRTPTYVLSWT